MQSAQFLTFQTIYIFLQIKLDGSNYHIFPPCFTQMKWKIEGSSAHKYERTLQFFTFFPAIYSTYNGSARKKSSRIFSCARVRIISNEFSPSNICLYIIAAAAMCKQTGQAWRLESAVGIYCLGRIWTRLKLAQMARHGYGAICAHSLCVLCYIDKLSTENRTLFYNGKMCECTQIYYEKCDDVSEYSYEKCEWWWLWC